MKFHISDKFNTLENLGGKYIWKKKTKNEEQKEKFIDTKSIAVPCEIDQKREKSSGHNRIRVTFDSETFIYFIFSLYYSVKHWFFEFSFLHKAAKHFSNILLVKIVSSFFELKRFLQYGENRRCAPKCFPLFDRFHIKWLHIHTCIGKNTL